MGCGIAIDVDEFILKLEKAVTIATLESGKIPKSQLNLTAGDVGAQPLGNELTALQALADTAGFLRKTGNGAYSIDTSSYLPTTGGTVSGDVNLSATTPSTSPTTGASVIVGGQGVGGDCHIGGRVYEGDTQSFLISTAINLAANNYINVGTINVPVNGKERIYLIYVYLQFDGITYNQAQGSTILSCIPWKSNFGSQSSQTFKMEAHAIDDFICSISLGRYYESRSINLSFNIDITTVLPGFLRVKFKELSY